MDSLNDTLAAKLAAVQRPGDYFVSGTVEAYLPQLEVESVGRVALPLLPQQAQQLIAVATQAPYGRGSETLIDTAVRKTRQINADQVKLSGRHWPQTLQEILDRVVAGLSVSKPVHAELYKLLVYEDGDFFVSHRDTEKAPGMFATLVIVLPSVYTGGELIIRHNKREVELDLCCEDASELVAFAAFYADCVHEVKPVTSGCRLTLIYNLVRPGSGQLPQPPDYGAEQDDVASLLRQWVATQGKTEPTAEKLIYPLEHAYTAAELGFDQLKGADAAIAPLLLVATEKAECELHLALLTIEESGSAEYADVQPRRGWHHSAYAEDSYEVGEVFERRAHLSEWRTPTGRNAGLRELPFHEAEICPLGALGDMEEAELEFHEATGNEGVSFDRSYCRAALVIWPGAQKLAMISQAGLRQSLPYLSELVARLATDDAPALRQQAVQLAALMLSTWPRRNQYHSGRDPNQASMLELLDKLADTALLERFLIEVAAQGNYSQADNPALTAACRLLPTARAVDLLVLIIMANKDTALTGCCGLLHASVSLAGQTELLAKLLPVATSLCQALPDGTAKLAAHAGAQAPITDSGMMVDLLRALGRLDAALGSDLAASTSRRLLATPEIYPLDGLIVPVALQMVGDVGAELLHQASLTHLKDRIAEPLLAPVDWRRDSAIACRCKDCAALSQFLADPSLPRWLFKAAEPARRHVQASVTHNQVDVDCSTDNSGRPYKLVCAKNQANYQRRVTQRGRDIADLALLQQAPG